MDFTVHCTYDFRVSPSINHPSALRATSRWLPILPALISLCMAAGCVPEPPKDPGLVISLRWIKNYPNERKRDVDTGLYWALSFLGATLPDSAKVLAWHADRVTLDLGAADVQPGSQQAWTKLLQQFKASGEYRKYGAIDIGRFVFVSLCSANHYYALTGTSPTLTQFLVKHAVQSKQIAVVESAVAHGNRLIEVAKGEALGDVAFIAYEGNGSLQDGSFRKQDVETLEFMKNGQLRFGLYGLDGQLETSATPALTTAGKPSKCLWCHEINLNPPFKGVTDVPGYYTIPQFRDLVTRDMDLVHRYRRTLQSKVDFRKTQDHAYAEDLYLSFAHPTAERLAAEWNMPLAGVRQLLQSRGLNPHPHSAYVDDAILGDQLYDRQDVEALTPYSSVQGPSDIREASRYEPDLLRPDTFSSQAPSAQTGVK